MKRFLTFVLFVLLLAGCATTSPHQPIRDMVDLPQDAGAYTALSPSTPLLSPQAQQVAYRRFLEEHFSPWERSAPKHLAEDVFWGLDKFENKKMFGENTLPRPEQWMKRMRALSRVEAYPSMGRKAISVTNTSMRVLPTNQPLFYDFSRPGEGYPFDYMQNSLVLAGTPLFASHLSGDRAWVMVESRFAYGWVRVTDIAWVEDGFASIFRTGTYGSITSDDVPIVDVDSNFRFMGHVGTILPVLEGGNGHNGLAFIVPARAQNGQAVPYVAFVPNKLASIAPLSPTPEQFASLANAMMGRPYGWGGLYQDRDCSAAIMDLMAGFGIYLPRNSSQQIKEGSYASLKGLSRLEKKQFIIKHATPFLTTIRKPGHIMLYIGERDGNPIIFHAAWGLKVERNGKIGRKVLGGAVVTTLEPGLELPELVKPSGVLLETVSGMATLPGVGER